MHKRKSRVLVWLTCLPAVIVALLSRGEIVSVTGSSHDGWTAFGVDEYADGGLRFNSRDDYILSPLYAGCVTQLVLTVRASSSTVACFLTAVPEVASAGARQLVAEVTTSYARQALVWSEKENVRQFRLQNIGTGNASWGLWSMDVYLDRVEAPRNLSFDANYSNALSVRWEPDSRAVEQELEVDRVEFFPTSYDLLEEWDFSVLTNTTGSSQSYPQEISAPSLQGVSGAYLNVQAKSGGYLQAGNTKGAGRLSLALSSEGSRTALMRLYRSAADGTDGTIGVWSVGSDGATNRVCEPYLTTVPREFAAKLSDDARELLMETAVKSRRFRVEDVRIVSDYVPACATTNTVVRLRTKRNVCLVRNLAPGEWIWRVRSFDADALGSVWSEYVAATLDATSPRCPPPGFVLLLR